MARRDIGEAVKEVPKTALQFAVGTVINEVVTKKVNAVRGVDTPANRVLSGVITGVITSIMDPQPMLSMEGAIARALIGGAVVSATELHRHWNKDQRFTQKEFDELNRRWVCCSLMTFATVSAVIIYCKVKPGK